jgi:hypothetical protein
VTPAKANNLSYVTRQLAVAGVLLSVVLVAGYLLYPAHSISAARVQQQLPIGAGSVSLPDLRHPLQDMLKLVAAFLTGMVLTLVHRVTRRDQPFSRSMEHAQVLLCVSGALMMVIIGDSLARAFGIAGAVSIVRFRTPVEDPKDSIILFLSLGLGMSAGLGAFALTGGGTIFLCAALVCLDRFQRPETRTMSLSLGAGTQEFPTAHVQKVLCRHGIDYETREITHGPEAGVKYRVRVADGVSLESHELRDGPGGIRSVVWEKSKKER